MTLLQCEECGIYQTVDFYEFVEHIAEVTLYRCLSKECEKKFVSANKTIEHYKTCPLAGKVQDKPYENISSIESLMEVESKSLKALILAISKEAHQKKLTQENKFLELISNPISQSNAPTRKISRDSEKFQIEEAIAHTKSLGSASSNLDQPLAAISYKRVSTATHCCEYSGCCNPEYSKADCVFCLGKHSPSKCCTVTNIGDRHHLLISNTYCRRCVHRHSCHTKCLPATCFYCKKSHRSFVCQSDEHKKALLDYEDFFKKNRLADIRNSLKLKSKRQEKIETEAKLSHSLT